MSRLRATQPGNPPHLSSIRMGQMSVARNGESLRLLLGSCVGVALYDKRHAVGGMAHIVLPRSSGATDFPGKFVDTAIPRLIDELRRIAGCKLSLHAKLAGGASMFKTKIASHIGRQNVEASTELLTELGIPIVAKHCGGEKGRKMILDTSEGRVTIEIIGQTAFEI